MGNKPSIGTTLEQRFGDLQKEYRAARDEETLDIWEASDLRRKLAQLRRDLQVAIEEKKVKLTDHTIQILLESIGDLDKTLKLLEEHFNAEKVEKRRLQREEAIAAKERDDLENDYDSMLKNLDRERERRFNVVHYADLDLIRASEHTRESIQKKLTEAQQSFDEIEKQMAYLRTSEGKEHWISERKILVTKQREEQERLEDERRRNAPDRPVELLDFGPVKDPLRQLQHSLVVLLEAGNGVGGYTEPDLDDVAMAENVSRVAAAITNLLDKSQLNQAGHTTRIYNSVDYVVTMAYKAGYNVDDPTVQAALRDLVIAYASVVYDSDSGERDQDGKLLPGLYGDLSTIKKH